MKYQTYIFDFNGTLLDDCDVCLRILNILTKNYHLKEVSKEEYKSIFTFPVKNYYEELGFPMEQFSKIGNEFHTYYDTFSPSEASLFPSVLPLLKRLKDENKEIVCLSASKKDTLQSQLYYYGIASYFHTILGLDNKMAYGKIDLALAYLKEANLKKETCVFIGDSLHDKEVADAMGIDCILVSTGHTSKDRLNTCNCPVLDDLNNIQ